VVNTSDLKDALETIERILDDLLLTPKCSKKEMTKHEIRKQEIIMMARLLRLHTLLLEMEETENA